jgi:predicted RNA binding protein YcfA (HicA-like mRNA interferase family)
MLTSSREIKRRLESEGWILDRIRGSHNVFRNPETGAIIVGVGLVRSIYRQAGWKAD